jgi:hypothetical protein
MAKIAPLYLVIELGPMFLFGAAGLYLALRNRRTSSYEMLLVLLSALFIAFLVMTPLEPNVVIRKGIKVLQIPLVVFASFACAAYLDLPRRHWLRVAGTAAIIAGFSTLCTDVLRYVDLDTDRPPSNTYISEDRMSALEYIRTHTAPDAIVQSSDEVRPERSYEGKQNWEVEISIPALGERRTLLGNYKKPYENHVPKAEITHRITILERVFTAKDPETLRSSLERLPPHYLLVDWNSPGPTVPLKELISTGYLEEVFQRGEISVLLKKEAELNSGASSLASG